MPGVVCEGESREEMRARARDSFKTKPPVEYVEVAGVMMTRGEWKVFIDHCPHEHFTHAGVELMDGSKMSICDRCKFIQHEAIAKIIEGQEEF